MEYQEKNHRTVPQDLDWERFGLDGSRNTTRRHSSSRDDNQRAYEPEYHYGHQPSDASEIFAQEHAGQPWWKSNFFISQPVLFGTWDGVFTSCLINIFGVIVFLRSGWIVAQAGIINAVLMVLSTVFVVLTSVMSAVGICERCRMESGGVYFLLAHVLGSRFGGAIGLLYVFGQAVGCALYVLGFGESLAELLGLETGPEKSPWSERGLAGAAVILLGAINVAGVKWVVKLQFILLLILLLAGLDFAVGSFVHTDHTNGFDGWMSGNLANNTYADYFGGYSWFTVFGVFFPTVTGIMAGINMSGDLRQPNVNIPNGTIAAVGVGTFLYLMFVIVLASTCTRQALKDYMIAAKVAALHFPLLAGLYVSSMSSCLAAMYGTPRVLQSIANENVIPVIQFLGHGRGPNKVPVYSMTVVAMVTITFIIIGQINTLGPVVTMPFLLTYAAVDYSYFALAQTFDMRSKREERFRYSEQSPTFESRDGYGAAGRDCQTDGHFHSDLDKLFPERLHHKKGTGSHTSDQSAVSSPEDTVSVTGSAVTAVEVGANLPNDYKQTNIHSKPQNWYSSLCNRWASLLGAVLKIGMMFLVHWGYALINMGVLFLVWFYIGQANPAVKPGVSAEFNFFRWLKQAILRALGKRVQEYEHIVVTPVCPGVEVQSAQLNEDNEDFASRRRYHQSSTVQGRFVDVDED
ncbi:Solute carrier family 12 member 8 [Frankliniella fusca]|uniref:Solute carrier family 12 member 8 n=1 Tax=Frankliniella fusca TaxID=407009 RepID=A0AAE1HQR2_9NEOP|nr:Solute carrier family 12 member 8 [Frankliniella fusca]